jgi:hypothetical protein
MNWSHEADEEKQMTKKRKREEARELVARGLGKVRKAISDMDKELAHHRANMKSLETDLAMGADEIYRGEDTIAETEK